MFQGWLKLLVHSGAGALKSEPRYLIFALVLYVSHRSPEALPAVLG